MKMSFCPSKDVLESKYVIIAGEKSTHQKKLFSMGISSVSRGKTLYLQSTVQNLIDNMSPSDMEETVIVVFLADFDQPKKNARAVEITSNFAKHVGSGLLRVIQAPQSFYPPLNNLKKKFGDSEKRISWRAKQAMDYAFLFCYCQCLSEYYVHLEDDIVAAPMFVPRLKDFIAEKKEWFTLDASALGYIGKVYHSSDLDQLASYIMLLYDEMPVDWLQNLWRAVKGPHDIWNPRPHALFQHTGLQSSLQNKSQYLQERYFDAHVQKYLGLNPPAQVTSNLTPHQGVPQEAYDKGSSYFWARGPIQFGSHVTITLETPVKLHRIAVSTGSNIAPKDFLQQGIVQVAENENSCSEFKFVGEFINGTYFSNIDFPYEVKCVKILVTKDQRKWLFIWDINIWPDNFLPK